MRNGANHSEHKKVNRTCANLSHACALDLKMLKRARAKHNKTEKMFVRRGALSSPPLACTTFANVRTRNFERICGVTISTGNLVGP